jgi:hypothetical protein
MGCGHCCHTTHFSVNEWCLTCRETTNCPCGERSERDPIYQRPSPNEQRGYRDQTARHINYNTVDYSATGSFSPRDDLEAPMGAVLKDLRAYKSVATGDEADKAFRLAAPRVARP